MPKKLECIISQSIYFAIKGHRPLTNHTSSTNIKIYSPSGKFAERAKLQKEMQSYTSYV